MTARERVDHMEGLIEEEREEQALETLGAYQARQDFDDKVATCDFWEGFDEWEESIQCRP